VVFGEGQRGDLNQSGFALLGEEKGWEKGGGRGGKSDASLG